MNQNWNDAKKVKGFKICHLNVRSLLPKFDLFNHEFLEDDLDVIGVSETWLHEIVNDNLISNPGYNLVRNDRRSDKRGGGLCFYIKDCVDYQVLTGSSDEDCEFLPIIIEKEFQKNILIVLTYRPPSGSVVKFLDVLRNFLLDVYREDKMDLLLMGDFNIDVRKTDDPNVRKLTSFMMNYTLTQTIHNSTRVGFSGESILDLMITNLRFITLADSFNLNLSDHLPTLLVYKKDREKRSPHTFMCRDYSKTNLEKYKLALSQQDWKFVYEGDNIGLIWDRMLGIFTELLETFCPYKTVTVKKNRPVYITGEIIEMGHERDRLFKLARRTKEDSDWIQARKQRQKVNYALKKAKAEYFKEVLIKTRGDSRKFWSKITELLPKIRGPEINTITNQETGLDIIGIEAANYINQFFCAVGDKLVSQLPNHCLPVDIPDEIPVYKYVWGSGLSEKQVQDEIKLIDINKSSGFTEINSRCLKICLLTCITEFTFLLNCCIRDGVFLSTWKTAIVVPILKQGNPKKY